MTAYARGDVLGAQVGSGRTAIALVTDNLTWVGTGGVNLAQAPLKVGTTTVFSTGGDLNSAAVGGQIISSNFNRLNVSANLSGKVIIPFGGNTTFAEFLAPRAGSIIGMAVRMSAAMGTGTADAWATINGTTQATSKCHFNAATAAIGQQVASAVAKDSIAVAQFDRIGVKLTTAASFAPVTIDMNAVVYFEV